MQETKSSNIFATKSRPICVALVTYARTLLFAELQVSFEYLEKKP